MELSRQDGKNILTTERRNVCPVFIVLQSLNVLRIKVDTTNKLSGRKSKEIFPFMTVIKGINYLGITFLSR